jgi:hypothetical protein
MLSDDLAAMTAYFSLLVRDDLGRMTLGAAVLAHHSAPCFTMPGYFPAGPGDPCACVPGSEVFLGNELEHSFFNLSFGYKLFQSGVFLLQLREALGLVWLHAAVELAPAVVGELGDLVGGAYVGNALPLGDQLLSGLELTVVYHQLRQQSSSVSRY